ncbi:sensor domain-containing diguanylate cyclase [Thioalkalivibrio denitrificans]|uniref:Sensor domain-containing diguanylate cyclase n=1 Tax=Thioalkalivibrio denitrificans TaxID=108003 RepID=A0A1V3NFB9_9GAMM|nr:diguanylate cyclase [Thioalkalivibrio denitrificans]OOG23623.1 sensor domain-containing diguanylate cyclase [Thioalkalivibrio denitrificans]
MRQALVQLIFSRHRRPSVALVRRSVLVTLFLLGVYVALSLTYLTSLQSAMTEVSEVHNRKVEIIHQMSNIVQARSLYLYTVALNEDPWFRDDQYMAFRDVAVDFIDLRERLRALGLTSNEAQLLDQALGIIRVTAPLQEDIMQRILGGEDTAKVHADIIEKDLPLELELLSLFDALGEQVRDRAHEARLASENRYHMALRVLSVVTLLIVLSMLLGAARVVQRLGLIEGSLHQEKELAVGTLNNIADGVIVTDASGTILSMNRPAEQMTGISAGDAQGRPIESVYRPAHPSGESCLSPSMFAALLSGPANRAFRPQRLVNASGATHHVEETVSPIVDAAGEAVRVSYIFRDIGADMARLEQMSWEASHDHLTGALNRRAFEMELRQVLASARQGASHTLVYLDLDDFKVLNDTFGHPAGDAYLIELARTMNSRIRRHDRLARLGGDEFVVLLRDCSVEDADTIIRDLFEGISSIDFVFDGRRVPNPGASIGVLAVSPEHPDAESIMRKVDEACYQAKRTGKNRICVAQ